MPGMLIEMSFDVISNFAAEIVKKIDVWVEKDGKLLLYKKRGVPLDVEGLRKFSTGGKIFISKEDKEVVEELERERVRKTDSELKKIIGDETKDPVEKATFLKTTVDLFMEEIFVDPRGIGSDEKVEVIVENTVDFLARSEENYHAIIKVRKHDYYTYMHCVNVMVFTVAIARKFGIDDEEEIRKVAFGGLLHDIGKSKVSLSILNKRGKLTEEEFFEIKKHPVYGYELTEDMEGVDEEARAIILQHHEKLNGTGYPKGLKGDEIHLYSKMATIADIYDALTTNRPYSPRRPPVVALNILKDLVQKGEVDKELFATFVATLKRVE